MLAPDNDKEATVEGSSRSSMSDLKEPSGWIVFAGVMILLVGFFTIIDGMVAIFNDKAYGVIGNQLIVMDYTQWGWIHLLLGIALVLVGFALLAEREWARWVAIFLVALNAITQISFLNASPIWSLIVIAIDVIIIYQLTANWNPETA